MDGLLIDSEDLYTRCVNEVLREYEKPLLPWSIKAQLQGRPAPEASEIFFSWAQLPISNAEYLTKLSAFQAQYFPTTQPLPGALSLVRSLATTATTTSPVHIALATSSQAKNYTLKTSHLNELFSLFPSSRIVIGDDPRIGAGRGKPRPDIYLLALEIINQEIRASGNQEPEIKPEECLVFEDSVPGVEAGRRAGMRVVWCPHEGLLNEYRGREQEVLAGVTGEHKELDSQNDGASHLVESWRVGAGKPGTIGDGWGQLLQSLEAFPYETYDINLQAT
ncbi:hypothetical protein LOZ39_002998 [Ophidiomyces ophidiicola]|nr:hypothetical protein LOZ61_001809 [Ophidiomyces ophidiicola]KAI1917857.1 hypothetical protein LOZ64_002982 [Ophidiomyces ophidiicola]KAI1929966.1 hypothetical protein LOZ60_001223 [Ophidiomyces ophidiicola]KAI1970596.1 hypothetical protein LOZ56_003559 [Ophidiomyces ophidiicola]KAI1977567.1 hypothetical protein LOZ55_003344 [Ophidiomyces ophidiicola]